MLFRQGHYEEAARRFESIHETAQSLHLTQLSGQALGNVGACRLALQRYQEALQLFLEARRALEISGDRNGVASFDANIASVYQQLGEYDAASEWVARSIAHLSGRPRDLHLPKMQIQLATLRGMQGRPAEALELFREGLNGADRLGDLELYAIGWNRLGEELLRRGEFQQAEQALLAAYYVRKLHHLPLESSYANLGQLRLAQGDFRSAEVLLDLAAARAGSTRGRVPPWQIYSARGRLRLAEGRLRPALDDLRVALRWSRAWRDAAAAGDAGRIAEEGKLAQMYSAFIEAGNRLYQETGDSALLSETFVAAEENRAASLLALRNGPPAGEAAMPGYRQSLDRLRHAELAALRLTDTADLAAARAEVAGLDAGLGPALRPLPPQLVAASRNRLPPHSVLLSFHLGPSISWLWALDRRGLALYALPPRNVIDRQVGAAVVSMREGRADTAARAAALYATLFAPLAERFQRAKGWLLVLDDSLFAAPMSALVIRQEPVPVYLAERHTVEVIPGVAHWLDSGAGAAEPVQALFVGVGDAIYNSADPRLGTERRPARTVLPRLVGSAAEIEASARAWGGPSVFLRGPAVTRRNLIEQLARRPAAVHLATHYLESAARPGYGLIALSLSDGELDLLTPAEIAQLRIQAGVVVLSGCHSAAGTPLPATGMPGLTRAWLAAGARFVVSTLWSTPDDDGALFSAFYRNLRGGIHFDAPAALRTAQLELIRSDGRRADPKYWGAYFIVGDAGRNTVEP